MPIDPLRRRVVLLARDALERRGGFEIIEELGIPALWERFCPLLSEEDAKTLCKTYYLDMVRLVRGHAGLVRRDSIRQIRESMLSKAKGLTVSSIESGREEYRAACVRAAKRIQREILCIENWTPAKGGRFKTNVSDDLLFISFDYGSYRENLEFDLKLSALKIRLAPSVLFCANLDEYLSYGPIEVFSERFENVMKIVVFFGNRLREC